MQTVVTPERPAYVVVPPLSIEQIMRLDEPNLRANLARMGGWMIRKTLGQFWRAIPPDAPLFLAPTTGPAALTDDWLTHKGVPDYLHDPREFWALVRAVHDRPYANWFALHPAHGGWTAEIIVPAHLRGLSDGVWWGLGSSGMISDYCRRAGMLEVRGRSEGVAIARAVLADHYCNFPGPVRVP